MSTLPWFEVTGFTVGCEVLDYSILTDDPVPQPYTGSQVSIGTGGVLEVDVSSALVQKFWI
jgi:hypothetical protein